MFETLAARLGPPDGESTFECVACGTETGAALVDCPECGEIVVRVVLDRDTQTSPDDPDAADTPAR